MDKDSYYRGFTDACDVLVEHLKENRKISRAGQREALELVQGIRARKAKEILSDLAA